MATIRVLVAFHSPSGTVAELARSVAFGAKLAGATVRLREMPGSADAARGEVAPAELDDLLWADGVALGGPTYFGNVSAAVLAFLATAGPAARAGLLADKAVGAFTAGASIGGGHEAAILALFHTLHHWGALIVPTGYTDPAFRAVGGNPYGLSVTRRPGDPAEQADAADAAGRALGRRLAVTAAWSRPTSAEPVVAGSPRQRSA